MGLAAGEAGERQESADIRRRTSVSFYEMAAARQVRRDQVPQRPLPSGGSDLVKDVPAPEGDLLPQPCGFEGEILLRKSLKPDDLPIPQCPDLAEAMLNPDAAALHAAPTGGPALLRSSPRR